MFINMKILQKNMEKKMKMKRTSDIQNIATTRILTRILAYLNEADEDNLRGIAKNLQMSAQVYPTHITRIKDGVLWLKNHNLIKENKNHAGGSINYSITRKKEVNENDRRK